MIAEHTEQIETVELTRRRFTVDEFLRMAEVGVLDEDERVELIWGEIVEIGVGKRHLFSVGDYLCLAESDILRESERIELILGQIINMSPIDIAHISTLNRLAWALRNALGKQVILSIRNPIKLSEDGMPQPDIAVLRFEPGFYSERHIGPDDILLLIEVADSSLKYDRRVKSTLYGSSGITEYWLVNLPARRIEVYREPRQDGYRTVTYYTPGETLSLLAFPDVVVNVEEILG
jgi:Uma2 family endonuclease